MDRLRPRPIGDLPAGMEHWAAEFAKLVAVFLANSACRCSAADLIADEQAALSPGGQLVAAGRRRRKLCRLSSSRHRALAGVESTILPASDEPMVPLSIWLLSMELSEGVVVGMRCWAPAMVLFSGSCGTGLSSMRLRRGTICPAHPPEARSRPPASRRRRASNRCHPGQGVLVVLAVTKPAAAYE